MDGTGQRWSLTGGFVALLFNGGVDQLDKPIPPVDQSIRTLATGQQAGRFYLSQSRIYIRWNVLAKAAGLPCPLDGAKTTQAKAQTMVRALILHELAHVVTLRNPINRTWFAGVWQFMVQNKVANKAQLLTLETTEMVPDCLAAEWFRIIYGSYPVAANLGYIGLNFRGKINSCDPLIIEYIRTNAFPTGSLS
jgi:hypothetical protein